MNFTYEMLRIDEEKFRNDSVDILFNRLKFYLTFHDANMLYFFFNSYPGMFSNNSLTYRSSKRKVFV